MAISESKLRRIIREEAVRMLNEAAAPAAKPAAPAPAGASSVFSPTMGYGATSSVYVSSGDWQWKLPSPTSAIPGDPQKRTYVQVLAPIFDGKKILASGSRGDDVKAFQMLLNDIFKQNGNRPIAVDGAFGPATSQAVETLQISTGIAIDKRVGQQTLFKLFGLRSSPTGQAGAKGVGGGGQTTSQGGYAVGTGAFNQAAIIGQKPTQR